MKTITKKTLKEFYGLYKKLGKLQEKIKKEQPKSDANKKREVEIERDGKKIMVKEEMLWIEVYQLGINCPAGKVLRGLYPKIFELSDKEAELLGEIKEYEIKNFGFYHKEMTMPNEIKLIRSLIQYEMDSKTK